MGKGFIQFELERLMSIWENQVDFNLSESGVHPLTIKELVQESALVEELLSTPLGYPQSNGLIELRQAIARLYAGASEDNILVTTGCAQANFTSVLTIMEPADEIAVMLPNYMQIWGVSQNFGYSVRTFSLKEELNWGVDLDELQRAVSPKTKMIAVVNPNNPTGHILTIEEMNAIVATAERSGAWLLCDEVYAGAERVTDEFTPSFWGRYERVVVTGSLSKAYAMPGLRIGWIAGPAELIKKAWAWQDYITISTTMLANKLAAYALSADVRPRIIKRTREYIRAGYQNFEKWYHRQDGMISIVPPQAAAIAFARYHKEVNSSELVRQLIQKNAFVLPGDLFGLDHFLRISFGLPADYLNEGLKRLEQVIRECK